MTNQDFKDEIKAYKEIIKYLLKPAGVSRNVLSEVQNEMVKMNLLSRLDPNESEVFSYIKLLSCATFLSILIKKLR